MCVHSLERARGRGFTAMQFNFVISSNERAVRLWQDCGFAIVAAASVIARSPLWSQGQPDQIHSLWREMKAMLHAAKQDWQVWTIWYDDRLEGRVRDKTRELAYVRIEEALWDQAWQSSTQRSNGGSQ